MIVFNSLVIFCLMVASTNTATDSGSRPFYLFAHMANSLSEVDTALSKGANAVEADVTFTAIGQPIKIYHGFFCDCFRDCFRSTTIGQYLDYFRRIGTEGDIIYNPQFTILYLDLKLSLVSSPYMYVAGFSLAQKIIESFFLYGRSPTRVNLIIGFENTKQFPAIDGFYYAFNSRGLGFLLNSIGIDISQSKNDDLLLKTYSNFTKKSGGRIWIGDGITNCLFRTDNRLRRLLYSRDIQKNALFNKCYVWTVDNPQKIRNMLRLPIDGMMTNDVSAVQKILAEPEFAVKYRLATNQDSPWEQVIGHGPFRMGCEQNMCWRDCSSSGDWCWTIKVGCSKNISFCEITSPCLGECGGGWLTLFG